MRTLPFSLFSRNGARHYEGNQEGAIIRAHILEVGVDDEELVLGWAEYWIHPLMRVCQCRQLESECKLRDCRMAEERAWLREIEVKRA